MFSPTKVFLISKQFLKSRSVQNILRNFESSGPSTKKVYSPLFFDEKVQHLLQKMTNAKLEIIFKPKATGEPLMDLKYKLMTTEEIKSLMKEFEEKAKYLLQIPPLIDMYECEGKIIDEDTSLDGFDEHHSKLIFVDTSTNLNNDERAIVVREPNGVLRTACQSERTRINQIYCPIPGREVNIPRMFKQENIQNILKREDYLFILDRACAQFEPYEKLYHETIEQVYEAINERNHFERLHSTRHFGSLVFYLVTHKKIDNLLIDNIKNERMENAYDLVNLYHIIHPKCKSAESSKGKSDNEILRDFIEFTSNKKDVLSLTLNALESKQRERENFESELKSSHGL